MTKDLIMGKTMKSFLKNYTRRFFPGPGLVRHFDDSATLVRTNRSFLDFLIEMDMKKRMHLEIRFFFTK